MKPRSPFTEQRSGWTLNFISTNVKLLFALCVDILRLCGPLHCCRPHLPPRRDRLCQRVFWYRQIIHAITANLHIEYLSWMYLGEQSSTRTHELCLALGFCGCKYVCTKRWTCRYFRSEAQKATRILSWMDHLKASVLPVLKPLLFQWHEMLH